MFKYLLEKVFCQVFLSLVFILFTSHFLVYTSCVHKHNKKFLIQDTTLYSPTKFTDLTIDRSKFVTYLEKFNIDSNICEDILSFYERRENQFAWFTENGISEAAVNFSNLVDLYKLQLGDSTIKLDLLDQIYEKLNHDSNYFYKHPEEIYNVEFFLTTSFFNYAHKAYSGIYKNPKDLEWYIPRRKKNYDHLLESIVKKDKDFSKYEPINPFYQSLRTKLIYLKSIFPQLTELHEEIKSLQFSNLPVDSIPKSIINYLKLLDEYSYDQYDCPLFSNYIQSYQKHHGINGSGQLDSITLSTLQISPDDILKKIIINMERMRWLTDTIPNRFILVNIPDYKLFVFDSSKYQWEMKVVVGKSIHATNIFAGNMEYLVFSPYWNIPPSIIKNEILPSLKKDQNYINRNEMEVLSGNEVLNSRSINWKKYKDNVPFTIRQKPGPKNALGKIKFIFPNNFNIYLHDTPAKSLFTEQKRGFSHGCVRLAEPLKLAEYLLSYNSSELKKIYNSDKEMKVILPHPISVLICYFTAWVDINGNLNTREDLYRHDEKLEREIFGKVK